MLLDAVSFINTHSVAGPLLYLLIPSSMEDKYKGLLEHDLFLIKVIS